MRSPKVRERAISTDVIAIVGLGYVGLPLAVAFGARQPTIGFDLNEAKIEQIRAGKDPSGEVDGDALNSARLLELSSDPESLSKANVIIVVVPTPIDRAKRPDLTPLQRASSTVGEYMQAGTTVVFESTVYPGCTEEVCVPILEAKSGFTWAGRGDTGERCDDSSSFHVGYSPERINPGDKTHRLSSITKVVAADTPATLKKLTEVYGGIIDAGVFAASSIKVAEAAKVIENTQRDLNIALMNELSMIFDRLGIDTLEVLEAAGTKWNFLPFRPGLVGGHCIGVDPYYLTYKAESIGYHPQVVLAGRRINDGMSKFVAEQTVKRIAASGKPVTGSIVNILGVTFKENCADIRNSRVPDIVFELQEYGCEVVVHDSLAEPSDALSEYGISLQPISALRQADALVLAVPHQQFLTLDHEAIAALVAPAGVVIDVKGALDRRALEGSGFSVWRL